MAIQGQKERVTDQVAVCRFYGYLGLHGWDGEDAKDDTPFIFFLMLV